MKWVGDLDGVGQHCVEHLAVRAGQIQRRPLDAVPPLLGALSEPLDRALAGPSFNDIKELTGFHVDDLGGVAAGVDRISSSLGLS